MLHKTLLVCGIGSSLLYVAATIVGATQWPDYDWTTLSISELFALDAPSRALVATSFVAYGVLVSAFGVGVWISAGTRLPLRVVGAALIGQGVIGETGPFFYSLHTYVRGVPAVEGDVMHAVVTLVLVLLILLSIGFGAAAFGRGFRIYSIVTFLAVLVFGALAGAQLPRIAADLPTPWLGVEERINVFGFMLWVAVLAVLLLRVPAGASARNARGRSRPIASSLVSG